MSEALNDIFISNFQKDPTLTWQYFGSSAGFFRLYPGLINSAFRNIVSYWSVLQLQRLKKYCIFNVKYISFCLSLYLLGIKWTPDANGVVAFDCRNRNWWDKEKHLTLNIWPPACPSAWQCSEVDSYEMYANWLGFSKVFSWPRVQRRIICVDATQMSACVYSNTAS